MKLRLPAGKLLTPPAAAANFPPGFDAAFSNRKSETGNR